MALPIALRSVSQPRFLMACIVDDFVFDIFVILDGRLVSGWRDYIE